MVFTLLDIIYQSEEKDKVLTLLTTVMYNQPRRLADVRSFEKGTRLKEAWGIRYEWILVCLPAPCTVATFYTFVSCSGA